MKVYVQNRVEIVIEKIQRVKNLAYNIRKKSVVNQILSVHLM